MDFFITLANRPWFFPVLGGLVATYLLTLSVVLAVWTARDARRRATMLAFRIGAPAFVLAFGLVGFVVYVALRPRRTLEERGEEQRERSLLARAVSRATCPSCKTEVESDFASCPFCKVDFAPVCANCGGVVQTTWKRCGFCGVEVSATVRAKKYQTPVLLDVELLAARVPAAVPKLKAPKMWPERTKKEEKPTAETPNASKPKGGKPKISNIGLTLRRLFAIKR